MNQKALVLVAHADDETLGAGGMISKLQANGWTVDVVALSKYEFLERSSICRKLLHRY